MDLKQTKLVGFTMELDLKAREYKMLCDKLEQLIEQGVEPNDDKFVFLKELFERNYKEIEELNKQIKEIK